MVSRLLLSALVSLLAVHPVYGEPKKTTLGFDGLADLASNVDGFGVTFTGATVLACGGSLNCVPFPPFSGRNVIYDQPGFGGAITATFDPSLFVTEVSARVTGNRSVTMTAYAANNAVLGSASTGGANYVGSGGTPNKLLAVTTTERIAKVIFKDGGNTFTVDDFMFSGNRYVVMLDPGHGLLADDDGNLHYQRPPSPTFGQREDNFTLLIANAARQQLLDDGYTVHLTRTTTKAPFAEAGKKGCGADAKPPFSYCNDDLKLRIELTDDLREDDDTNVIFVSIHTNGSDFPVLDAFVNGTETYYCKADSIPLAQNIQTGIVAAIGTSNRGVKNGCNPGVFGFFSTMKAVLIGTAALGIPNALTEVAYHSNNNHGLPGGTTDEERLIDPAQRKKAGQAIAKAIEQFIDETLNKE